MATLPGTKVIAESIKLLLIVSLLSAFGCGGGNSVTPSSPAPIQSTSTAKPKFAYSANELTANLSGYAVDPASGVLTPLAGFPITSGENPVYVIHDPQNRFVLVADIAANLVTVYAIDSATGNLTEVPPSPYAVEQEPRSLAIDPSGKFVYVGSQALNSITAFSMNSDGGLTQVPGSPFPTGGMNSESIGCCVVVDPAGKFLYTKDLNDVYSFRIDPSTGALTLITTIFSPEQGGGLAIDAAGQFLYAVGPGSNSVQSFTIDSTTGVITPFATSPLALNNGAITIALDPSGHFAYTVESGQTLVAYSVQNGTLTAINGTYSGAVGSLQLAIDPSNSFIYAPQTGTENNISGFRINASGALSVITGSPTVAGGWPFSITITSQ